MSADHGPINENNKTESGDGQHVCVHETVPWYNWPSQKVYECFPEPMKIRNVFVGALKKYEGRDYVLGFIGQRVSQYISEHPAGEKTGELSWDVPFPYSLEVTEDDLLDYIRTLKFKKPEWNASIVESRVEDADSKHGYVNIQNLRLWLTPLVTRSHKDQASS